MAALSLTRRGFTLLESLLALGISAILAAALTSATAAVLGNWRDEEGARAALSSLHRARWLALTEECEHRVSFSPGGGMWNTLLQRREGGVWRPAGTPLPLPRQVTLVATTGPAWKEFNPDGTSGTGSVLVTVRGERRYRLTLTAATGRIRLTREP